MDVIGAGWQAAPGLCRGVFCDRFQIHRGPVICDTGSTTFKCHGHHLRTGCQVVIRQLCGAWPLFEKAWHPAGLTHYQRIANAVVVKLSQSTSLDSPRALRVPGTMGRPAQPASGQRLSCAHARIFISAFMIEPAAVHVPLLHMGLREPGTNAEPRAAFLQTEAQLRARTILIDAIAVKPVAIRVPFLREGFP